MNEHLRFGMLTGVTQFSRLTIFSGLNAQAENHTSSGSVDLLIKTDKYIYLFEFKIDHSAHEAIEQINNREYALQWQTDDRKLYKIGVEFSSEKRNIKEWIIESP